MSAITELSKDERNAVVLRHMEGTSIADIVELMGLSEASIAGLLRRAMQQLRSCLGDEQGTSQ